MDTYLAFLGEYLVGKWSVLAYLQYDGRTWTVVYFADASEAMDYADNVGLAYRNAVKITD